MLTPEWIDDSEYSTLPAEVRQSHGDGLTVFYLPLRDGCCCEGIEAEMARLESGAMQLLFLRRVRSIHLYRPSVTTSLVAEGRPSGTLVPLDGSQRIRIEQKLLGSKLHRNLSQSSEETRCTEFDFEIETCEDVTVAVPCLEEPLPQQIYVCLLVRAVGFRFGVNAPFELVANRSDLHRSTHNSHRRDSGTKAFLDLCRNRDTVSGQALAYLGSEPSDPFWQPVRAAILAGLREGAIPCVSTETGSRAAPRDCILRGGSHAAKWVPGSLLEEACVLSFVAQSNPCGHSPTFKCEVVVTPSS